MVEPPTITEAEPPTITEATILEREVDTKYVCRATGIPVPTITWRAINVTTNESRTLVDNDNGITIVKVTIIEDVISELFLIHGLNLERISCIAENDVERVVRFENEFEDLGGNDITSSYVECYVFDHGVIVMPGFTIG